MEKAEQHCRPDDGMPYSCKVGYDGASEEMRTISGSDTSSLLGNEVDDDLLLDPRAARKAAKKRGKEERRAKRQGLVEDYGRKECTVCHKSVDLLIRCTIDATLEWNMVCGKCWNSVSGGVVDGDADHPHYRYGGLWKNRAKRV